MLIYLKPDDFILQYNAFPLFLNLVLLPFDLSLKLSDPNLEIFDPAPQVHNTAQQPLHVLLRGTPHINLPLQLRGEPLILNLQILHHNLVLPVNLRLVEALALFDFGVEGFEELLGLAVEGLELGGGGFRGRRSGLGDEPTPN